MDKNEGEIISIRGQVVEVIFHGAQPSIHDLLTLEHDPKTRIEVFSFTLQDTCLCIALTNIVNLYRGAKLVNTGKPISVPATEKALGRVVDIFGEPQDGKEKLVTEDYRSIYSAPPSYETLRVSRDIIE